MDTNDYMKIFSKNLEKYIRLSGKTKKEVAEHIGVSPSTITSYLQGKTAPRMGKVDRLCELFHISRSELLEENNNNVQTPSHIYNDMSKFASDKKIINLVNIVSLMNSLNIEGSNEAVRRVEELTYIPKYTEPDNENK